MSSPSLTVTQRMGTYALLGAGMSLAATLLLAFAATLIPVRQVESRIDALTGSISWQTSWIFGIASSRRVEVSPLETRLRGSGISWTPSWRLLHSTHRNLIGAATCIECGISPPIYELRPVLQAFAATATDEELREFVRIMQSNGVPEQHVAVDAASNSTWQRLDVLPASQ